MVSIKSLHRGWKDALGDLVASAEKSLIVVSPFMSVDASQYVIERMPHGLRSAGRLNVVTDLSPRHVCDGSLDPQAVEQLVGATATSRLWHVPKLHAKVYIADQSLAIVTSGNLTTNALRHNIEYGVEIRDEQLVRGIHAELCEIMELGALVQPAEMSVYSAVAKRVRQAFERQEREIDPELRRAFRDAIRVAEDELIKVRLAGGAMHTVFAKTILYLLRRHGPLATTAIHELVQGLHPDLCDDSVDRVIAGKSFGKKWKHAVRTAQQNLKKNGLVRYTDSVWRPEASGLSAAERSST